MTFTEPVYIVLGTFLLHQSVFWIYNGLILLITGGDLSEPVEEVQNPTGAARDAQPMNGIDVFVFVGCSCGFQIDAALRKDGSVQSNFHPVAFPCTDLPGIHAFKPSLASPLSAMVLLTSEERTSPTCFSLGIDFYLNRCTFSV